MVSSKTTDTFACSCTDVWQSFYFVILLTNGDNFDNLKSNKTLIINELKDKLKNSSVHTSPLQWC